jgi:DNA repair ATPase RecN
VTDSNNRLDRIEQLLDQLAVRLDTVGQRLDTVSQRLDTVGQRLDTVGQRLDEMVVRQQYHDEALERHDIKSGQILEMVMANRDAVHDLLEVAISHQRRLSDLENDQAA